MADGASRLLIKRESIICVILINSRHGNLHHYLVIMTAMQQESQKVKIMFISSDKCIQLQIKLLLLIEKLPNLRKLQNLDKQRIGVG